MIQEQLYGYKALIRDKERRILLLEDTTIRRGKPFRFWDLPGGKPEQGEEPWETVMREVYEETALRVIPCQVIGEYRITIDRGEVICPVHLCVPLSYDVDIKRNPAHGEDIVDYRWDTIDDAIRKTMSRSLRSFLRSVQG